MKSDNKKLNGKQHIIFGISGGVGKNIVATAVVNSLREQYPKAHITVTTPHTTVWKNNPDIDDAVNFADNPNFYRDYIKGKDILYLGNDPYLHQNYIYKKEHLIKTWCSMFDIKYNGSMPKLYFTDEENQKVKAKLPKGKLFFIQVSGGADNQENPISWARDLPLPIAQKVVNHMKSKGYEIIQIRRKDQIALANVVWFDSNIREMMCSLQYADKLLLIDSVAQHATVAFNKKAVVVWIGNLPKILGYEIHTNITPKIPVEFRHYPDSFLDKYNITGIPHECPYDTNDLFDFDEIIKALEK